MKKFTVQCLFNGQPYPFDLYIGSPRDDQHPLHNQSNWLSKERGGIIPQEVMDSIEKLRNLARENNVSFEELAAYALNSAINQ